MPIKGGAENAIFEITKRITTKDINVTILTPNINSTYKSEIGYNLLIKRTSHIHSLFGGSIMSLPFSFNYLRNNMHKFDLIHQFYIYPHGGLNLLLKRIYNIPLITSLMGSDTYDPISIIWKLTSNYNKIIMNGSDRVTTPSKELYNRAKLQGLKKEAILIPHGVDINKYSPSKYNYNIRKYLGLKDDDIMILSVQRLVDRKRIEFLLYSIKYAIRKNNKLVFVICGDGGEKKRLQELSHILNISKNVIFTGFISEDQLPQYYATCDIFVLHTLYEAFGLVLAEAMASGKPVISTNVGSVPEVVENDITGLIVPPMDYKEMGEAILKLSGDSSTRIRMGENGYNKARRCYDWDMITQKYLKLYNEFNR